MCIAKQIQKFDSKFINTIATHIFKKMNLEEAFIGMAY